LAFVAAQNKVKGFNLQPTNEAFAHQRDESIMRVENAHLVSGQKDSFNPEEQSHNLQKGPPKMYIDQQNTFLDLTGTSTNPSSVDNLDSFSSSQHNAQTTALMKGDEVSSFFINDNDNTGNLTQINEKQVFNGNNNYEKNTQNNHVETNNESNFFNDFNNQDNFDYNHANYGNNNIDNNKFKNNVGDVTIVNKANDTNNIDNNNRNGIEQQNTNEQQTFLSIWQQQRRVQLEAKEQKEREDRKINEDNAKQEILEFNEKTKTKNPKHKKRKQSSSTKCSS